MKIDLIVVRTVRVTPCPLPIPSTKPKMDFGQSVKVFDEPKLTSFVHIHIPKASFSDLVKIEGEGFLVDTKYIFVWENYIIVFHYC